MVHFTLVFHPFVSGSRLIDKVGPGNRVCKAVLAPLFGIEASLGATPFCETPTGRFGGAVKSHTVSGRRDKISIARSASNYHILDPPLLSEFCKDTFGHSERCPITTGKSIA